LGYMFRHAEAFNQPLDNWNLHNNATIPAIFNRAILFNQDISGWNISGRQSIKQVFHGALAFDQDISGWDVSSVTEYTNYGFETNHSNSLFTSSSEYYFSVNNVAPVFTSTSPSKCLDNTAYSYTPTATDANLDSITFSLYAKNETGPAWLNWNGTTLSGTALSGNIGNTTVTLRVTDGVFNVDQSFTIQVTGSTKLVMKVSGITGFDTPFYALSANPFEDPIVPYMIIRTFDNNSIQDEGEMTSKTGLNSSTIYKLEMILPIPGLTIVGEDWGIYFKGNSLAANNTLDIINFDGMPLYNGGGSAANLDGYGEQFYEFNGQISATDAPSIRINTNLRRAFYNSSFQGHVSSGQALNLSNWDLSNVICSARMFEDCANLGDGFDVTIDNWNLSNSNLNDSIFEEAFGYNNGSYNSGTISIKNWNITEDLTFMFQSCTGFNGDLSGWTITDPTNMTQIFMNCTEFTGIGLSSWTVTSPAQLPYSLLKCFNSCHRLGYNQHIDISHILNGGTWDYTYVSTLREALARCGCLGINTNSSFKMDGCNFINLLESDGCYRTFFESFGHVNGLDGLTYPNASNGISMTNWKISKTTGISLENMFRNTQKFNGDLTGWEITDPTSFEMIFSRAYKYRGNLSTWTVTSPNNLGYTCRYSFHECRELGYNRDLNLSDSNNGGGGTWDWTYCTSMENAFFNAWRVGENCNFIMNGCNFVNCTTFNYCFHASMGWVGSNYPNLSLQNWKIGKADNTSGVNLNRIFSHGNSPKSQGKNMNVTGWTIYNPNSMAEMFINCAGFIGVGISSWTVTSPVGIGYSLSGFCQNSLSLGLNQHIDISDSSNAGLLSYDPDGVTFDGPSKAIDLSSEFNHLGPDCVPCTSNIAPFNSSVGTFFFFDTSVWSLVFGEVIHGNFIGPVVVYRNGTRIYYGDIVTFSNSDGTWCRKSHHFVAHSWGNELGGAGDWQIGDSIAPARNEILYPILSNSQTPFFAHNDTINSGSHLTETISPAFGISYTTSWTVEFDFEATYTNDHLVLFGNTASSTNDRFYFGSNNNQSASGSRYRAGMPGGINFESENSDDLKYNTRNIVQFVYNGVYKTYKFIINGIAQQEQVASSFSNATISSVNLNRNWGNYDTYNMPNTLYSVKFWHGTKFSNSGILGNSSRTIIATIKTNITTANNNQFICGYGLASSNAAFGVRLRNSGTFGGNNSDKYVLGLMGYSNDFHSNFQITANVETTIVVSYNSENNTVYFFKKEENSTIWTMDVVFDRWNGTTSPLNTTLGQGFMIGGYPSNSTTVSDTFYGTIRHLKVFDSAFTTIQEVQNNIGTWDYTYVTDFGNAFYRCGCLGINSNSSFKMDGCNFVNLTDGNGMYESFRESFGNSSYTNGNSYPTNSNGVRLKNWNIKRSTSDGLSLGLMFYGCTKFDGDLRNWIITNPSDMSSMFDSCSEFNGKGISSWTITSPAGISYSLGSFCQNCTKFDQSLGFLNTDSVNSWSNWLDNTTLSVGNMATTFALWETKTFIGTPTINFGNGKYNFKGWVSKENIYNTTGVTLGGSGLAGGVGLTFVIPNVPEENDLNASFFNTVENPIVYSYSPIYTKTYPGGTFDGSGTLLDMNMNEAAMMGDRNRTFIATIKTTHSGSEKEQAIFGYGSNQHDMHAFSLSISNKVNHEGNGDNIYSLILVNGGANQFFSKFKVYTNIETTVGISYEGSGNYIYIFKKDPIYGIWEMDAIQLSIALWTTPGSHHNRHPDRGLAIGSFPFLGGVNTASIPFFGTIHNLTICNYSIDNTNQLWSPNTTLNWSVSSKPNWLSVNADGTQLTGKPSRSDFGSNSSFSTTITLSVTNFENETLNQNIVFTVNAPEDYEDWTWKKEGYYSVSTLFLDDDYHYFESDRCEADGASNGKVVLTPTELNMLIQNTSNRFKYGTIMAIMYNVDIRDFLDYKGTDTNNDGRHLWYIGPHNNSRDGDDDDNMHQNFTWHRDSNNNSREWMRPRMFYEGDEYAADIRVAREDYAFSRDYDWMLVTSWRNDGGSGSRHVFSMMYRPHSSDGNLGKLKGTNSNWQRWRTRTHFGNSTSNGNDYRTDSGVPFWEDKVATSHNGLIIGGLHRTDKDNRQFPFDCRVLVLKDYYHGRGLYGSNSAVQQGHYPAVDPKYYIQYTSVDMLGSTHIEFDISSMDTFSFEFFHRVNDQLSTSSYDGNGTNYYGLTRLYAGSTFLNWFVYDVNYELPAQYKVQQPNDGQWAGGTGVSASVGNWTHIVMTHDRINSVIKYYINGTETLSGSVYSTASSMANWSVYRLEAMQRGAPTGVQSDHSYKYKLYNNVILSQNEITVLYDAGGN